MITESINRMLETEAPTNPFPGLRPFQFDESHLYFGRDGQSEQLLRKLSSTRFVAVVGTSGSGKSSLVRAGLLPALYGGLMTSAGSNWRVALMRPGNDPIGNLARALNSPDVFGSEIEENAKLQTTITEVTLRRGSLGLVEAVRQNRMTANENLLVIADQFEELFRYAQVAADERYQNEAAAFVKLLLEAAHQREVNIYVVLTLRSDYLGDCSLFWDLPEAINEGQYLIPRLTREQRREAITGPVAVGGAEITGRLVNRLLNEIGDNPDQLPILQHALMRTWNKWKDEGQQRAPIDLEHYEAIGGMSEALSRHADEAYFELPDERSRLIAEKLFKALTEKGKDNRETRRPTELREICAIAEATEAEVIAVVEPFRREGRSFLMPPATVPLHADSLIDISHESLIRNWQRLSSWVDEESRSVRIYQRLAETAALHEKQEAGLWHDPDLQLALDWREKSRPNQAWARRYHPGFESAMAFLEESLEAREQEAETKERQRKRELRRTRLIAAVLLVAFIFSLASAVYAFRQQREASRQRTIAEQQTQQAVEQKEIAERNSQEAVKQKEIATQQSQEALKQQGIAEEQSTKAQEAEKVAVNQKQEAEKARLQAIRQARLAKDSENKAKEASEQAWQSTQVALREQHIAVAEEKKNLHLLYAANLNLAQQAYDNKETVRAQKLLDVLWPQKDELGFEWYYLWQRYHSDTTTFKGHTDIVTSVALSPDGKTLATGSTDTTVKLWNVATGEVVMTFNNDNAVMSVAFSPDGKTLATGGGRGNVVLWDIASQGMTPLKRYDDGAVFSLAFSPDGKTLAIANVDGKARLLEIASKQERITLAGDSSGTSSVAFSPDGKTLATGGRRDKTARIWNVATGQQIKVFKGNLEQPTCVAFSPDGKRLATSIDREATKIWDIATEQVVAILKDEAYILSIAFSPDGRTLATSTEDGTVKLWDIVGQRELTTLRGHTGWVTGVVFSSDGKTLATGSADTTAKLWKTGSRDERTTPIRLKDVALSLTFSPDGKTLTTGSYDGSVKLWDTTSRRELSSNASTLPTDAATSSNGSTVTAVAEAFSPDGKIIATSGRDNTVKLWDIASGQELLPPLAGHTDNVRVIAFSPDGKTLATGGDDKTIKLWDVASRRVLATIEAQDQHVTAVAFSSDGKTLATGSGIGAVKLWDVAAGRARLLFTSARGAAPSHAITSLAFSPDGKKLATGSEDQTFKLWDVASGEVLKTLEDQSTSLRYIAYAVTALAFSPDGKTLATGGDDKVVKLWSTASGQELVTLKGHFGAISVIAFSPDGRILATGGFDSSVRLWYAATDEEIIAQRGRKEK
jgi:WD40 repeat protein/energy-coupling factor transporter ATP-binding protein EcfA2